jgi:hypothetical protein
MNFQTTEKEKLFLKGVTEEKTKKTSSFRRINSPQIYNSGLGMCSMTSEKIQGFHVLMTGGTTVYFQLSFPLIKFKKKQTKNFYNKNSSVLISENEGAASKRNSLHVEKEILSFSEGDGLSKKDSSELQDDEMEDETGLLGKMKTLNEAAEIKSKKNKN